jgi:hypothetical protein
MLGRIVKATGCVTYDTPESAAAAGEDARPALVEDVGPVGGPADEGGAPTYVQLTDPAEIAGKTVDRVERGPDKTLFFVFKDATFAVVGIKEDGWGDEVDRYLTLDQPARSFDRVLLGLSPDGEDGFKKVYIARIGVKSGEIESNIWVDKDPHPSEPEIDDGYKTFGVDIVVISPISDEHACSEAIRVREEWLPQHEAKERQRQEARAAQERAEYERLKAKFEGAG